MKRIIHHKTFTAFAVCVSLLLPFAGCELLQSSLSTVQQEMQSKGIGEASSATKVFWFNGTESSSVKGQEAHLVLDLNQFADDDDANVTYTLGYTLDGMTRTATGTGKGSISAQKTKYYVDLSPAINLIDGSGEPEYSDISYSVQVSGLKNAVPDSEYNGRTFSKFSTTLKFAPLFIKGQELVFSSADIPAGTTLEIPLNGKISAVGDVTVSEKDGELPSGLKFTASVSEDGTKILLAANVSLTEEEFTADITVGGIKPVGSKETYSHKFEDFTLSNSVVIEKKLTDFDLNGEVQEAFAASEFAEYESISKMEVYAKLSGEVEGWWIGACDSEGGNYLEVKWVGNPTISGYEYEGTASRGLISAAKESGLYVKGLSGLKADIILRLSVPAGD